MLLHASSPIRPDLTSWTYETYERKTPSFQFDTFTALVSLWHSKKRGKDLPAWHDFDPADLRCWMGAIAIWRRGQSHPGITTRLVGPTSTTLDRTHGRECNAAFSQEPKSQRREADYLCSLLERGNLGRERGTLALVDGKTRAVEVLSLPFADDGTKVSHLLSIHNLCAAAPRQVGEIFLPTPASLAAQRQIGRTALSRDEHRIGLTGIAT